MSEDTLITALEEEAFSQAERILEEARASAEGILSDVRAEVSRERERRSAEVDAEMKAHRAALLNAASIRAAGAVLSVRHSLIEEAMAEAVKKFSSMHKDEYGKFLNQLFSEVKAEWEKHRPLDEPVALVAPSDIGLIETAAQLKADESVSSGVVMTTLDGSVRFENTVEGRLARAKAAMMPAMNEMLFDGVFP
ncbi:MAG: V-type ATP synthase subunit E [Deltaproteobacteria bacterium]|nr:V-type ATP synthase subunit E [Deltaproteobacteria bacterium]